MINNPAPSSVGAQNNNIMAKKEKEIKMTMTQFNYEIVLNIGNYQSVRIGGEWSVTDTPTTEQVVKIDAELRQKVAEVVESRKASVPQPQPQPQPTTEQSENKENKENKPENKPQQAEKPVDTSLEFVPSNSPKFQAILKKIQAGTPEETVRKYFRFDERGEQVIAIAYSDLIKENGKPIEDLKYKLPKKQDKPKDTQNKDLPKIPNQKS